MPSYDQKWLTMIPVSMGIFLATIDSSIVNVALPTLVHELATDFALVQWVVLSYLLTVTTLMMSVGRLADMMGKKQLYRAGFLVFTVSSVLCGISPTVHWLIAFRIVQGIGAAMIMALGPAIVTEAFPPSERGKALGVSGAVVSVGIVLGPTLGGVILDLLSWHWIFLVNLPVGIVGVFLIDRYIPAIRPSGGQTFDYPGALTLFLGLLMFLLAMTIGQQEGFRHPAVAMLFVASIAAMILFRQIEIHSRDPLLDLNLLRNRVLSVNILSSFLVFILIAGMLFLMPFYLANVLHHDPRSVGLLMSAIPVALGITSPIAGSLSDRFGTRTITTLGLFILIGSYGLVSTLDEQTSMMGYVIRCLPLGVGMGLFNSPNNSAIMGAVPRTQLGVASGLMAITRTLGQTTGIALLASIWANRAMSHADAPVSDITALAPTIQVAALHDTALFSMAIVSIACLLNIWLLFWQPKTHVSIKTTS